MRLQRDINFRQKTSFLRVWPKLPPGQERHLQFPGLSDRPLGSDGQRCGRPFRPAFASARLKYP